MFNHERLICYRLTMELAKAMPRIIGGWDRGYHYLTDQLKRALSSVTLNISEGNGRQSPKERKRFFTIARASAAEVSSIVEIAHAYGLMDREDYDLFRNRLVQIVRILYRLR